MHGFLLCSISGKTWNTSIQSIHIIRVQLIQVILILPKICSLLHHTLIIYHLISCVRPISSAFKTSVTKSGFATISCILDGLESLFKKSAVVAVYHRGQALPYDKEVTSLYTVQGTRIVFCTMDTAI